MKILLTLSLLVVCALPVQDAMEPAKKLEQHEWLQQLAGEWTVKCEVVMAPGAEAMTWESTESVRSLGGLWILAEGKGEFGGQSFTSLMTLGYDPAKSAFVGTWVDTMQTTLWTYVGHLDASKKILTLEAEGPAFHDPKKTAKYRDQIEIVSADEKKLTSSMLAEDGSWTTFMKAQARRVK